MEKKLPNIIIFNPDQWRGDVLAHMGNPGAVTPNLDRFAATEGVSFRNAFCQNPVCTPSRCSFMSGWYPHVRGHRSMARMLHQPDDNNLLKLLKDNGYTVWWGGKNDLVPGQLGFEEYADVKYARGYGEILDPDVKPPEHPLYPPARREDCAGNGEFYSFYRGKIEKGDAPYARDWDWANVEGAVDYIRNYKDEKPLCLFLAIAYPHPPYSVEDPWYSLIDRGKIPPRAPGPESCQGKCGFMKAYHDRIECGDWPEERWRELRGVYYGQCARVDHQFGMVVDALKEAGMYDDSAVFFFPDHGDFTGDYNLVEKHQICFEDCLTRVPFLIKPPAGVAVQPGTREAMVELIDFPATVENLTGLKLPHPHFGRSLLPVLAGGTDNHRDAVFCEGGRLEEETYVAYADMRKPPTPDGVYWPKVSLQQERLEFLGKAVMVRNRRYKLVKRLYEADELYDLERDPGELKNVYGKPEYEEARRDMEDRLLKYYLETSDVVPSGHDNRE
ncbi:MAG: sulfatase-like hydrolase/transferase [Kiritimatiellia bacterium]